MSEEMVLRMSGIIKTFPGVKALDDVRFDLKPGEVHVLLGENGAGKSTLIKILSGVYPKDSGEIFINGKKEEIRNPSHAQQLGISTIYQEFNLVPQMNVAENIFLGREFIRYPRSGWINWNEMRQKAREVLDWINTDIEPETLVKNLGVAQQQMIEIAKALSVNAKILIMDEPTAALTKREIERLFEVINRVKAQGVGVIYISHRLEEIKLIGDRVTVLRDGGYIDTVNVAETNIDQLITMMVGRDLDNKFPRRQPKVGNEALRVEGLYREGALHNINFSINQGEIVGLAGLVGAGRTELGRCIFGADPKTQGRILVKGKEVTINSPQDAIKYGICYLPEDRKNSGLILKMQVKENITLPSLDAFQGPLGLNLKREKELAGEYVAKLSIKTPSLDRKVKNLSGGNQQKTVIAKWLCANADIFIFDEPTRGIDVGAKIEVYELMNELLAQNAAILMISSELPEILGMSDRVLVMRNGTITADIPREGATQEEILKYAMVEVTA